MEFVKKNILSILAIILLGFILIQNRNNPTVDLLKTELEEIKKDKNDLINVQELNLKIIDSLELETGRLKFRSDSLSLVIQSKITIINTKISEYEKYIDSISNYSDDDADRYLSEYEFTKFRAEENNN